MNLKAILVILLLLFASATTITLTLISASTAFSIKPMVSFSSELAKVNPLGEIIDDPIAPS